VGGFVNFEALTQTLRAINRDVMVLCAGWKNRFNLEDTLFAGAVTENLLEAGFTYATDSDAAVASLSLYRAAKNDMFAFLENSSHRTRLERLNLEQDIKYCLSFNKTACVPFLKEHALIDANRHGGIEIIRASLVENKAQ